METNRYQAVVYHRQTRALCNSMAGKELQTGEHMSVFMPSIVLTKTESGVFLASCSECEALLGTVHDETVVGMLDALMYMHRCSDD